MIMTIIIQHSDYTYVYGIVLKKMKWGSKEEKGGGLHGRDTQTISV